MKIALIVVGCLLALMAVLLCLRAGVLAEYSEDGVLGSGTNGVLALYCCSGAEEKWKQEAQRAKEEGRAGEKGGGEESTAKKGGLPLRATLAPCPWAWKPWGTCVGGSG